MTDERFSQLITGLVSHPLGPKIDVPWPILILTRLALALRCVVAATGKVGEEALEKFCSEREEEDRRGMDA